MSDAKLAYDWARLFYGIGDVRVIEYSSPISFIIEDAERILSEMPECIGVSSGWVNYLTDFGTRLYLGSFDNTLHAVGRMHIERNVNGLYPVGDVVSLTAAAFERYRIPVDEERIVQNRKFTLALKRRMAFDFRPVTVRSDFLKTSSEYLYLLTVVNKVKALTTVGLIKHPEVLRNDAGQIHAIGEPAILFEDGWGIYAVNGVLTRKHLKNGRVTPHFLQTCRNAEERRVWIERVGFDNFIGMLNGKLIDKSEYGEVYRLRAFSGENEVSQYVRVINSTQEPDGTFKEYFLRIPPWIEKAQSAAAWIAGFPHFRADRYCPVVQT